MANYQVLSLDPVTPQIRAPGTGNGYSFDSGATNLGTWTTSLLTAATPLTLSTGTQTTSAPIINGTQTWNNAATTFTGLLANITDTASAAASLLMDLQIAGTSKFNVKKDGSIVVGTAVGSAASPLISFGAGTNYGIFLAAGSLCFSTSAAEILRLDGSNGRINSIAGYPFVINGDTFLARDAANTFAQRNGTNAQTLRVYNTYTDASNYERGVLDWTTNANQLTIGTQNAGTGTARSVVIIATGNTIQMAPGGANTWKFDGLTGSLLANSDNAWDIGASGLNRPRYLYLAGGSLTGSAANSSLTISPTWNTTGTPTAILLNVTDTASNGASLLMDLQVGGASKFTVDKNGIATVGASSTSGGIIRAGDNGFRTLQFGGGTFGSNGEAAVKDGGIVVTRGAGSFSWENGGNNPATGTIDLSIWRDAAATLAQRNGTNAQTLRVYNTYTDASNYERAVLDWGTTANLLTFGTQKAGTGSARSIAFVTGGVEAARIDTSSNVGIGLVPVASNGILQLNSYASVKALLETATVSATAATGTINFDVATQAVLYYTTNSSANWTVNVRANSSTALNTIMQTGQSCTITFLVTNGTTGYYNSAFQVDGVSVTPKWLGGTAPTTGNASSVDVYTYTIVKTGSAAFTVFASQTQFK